MLDAIVIGAGPNGLAAAIRLAEQGYGVRVYEAHEQPGGGVRSAALTLPGFVHDAGSAIHPLTLASPWLRTLPLDRYGLEWIQPPVALAHPFDDGTAALLYRDIDATAATLGADDERWRRVFGPFVADAGPLLDEILGPLHLPRHPLLLARFGVAALQAAVPFAGRAFEGPRARALFSGMAAHSILPLEEAATTAFGLVLGLLGHAAGWPFPRGGAQRITDTLAAYLTALGGEIITGTPVERLDDLPQARAYLFDTSAGALARIAGDRLPEGYRRRLRRFRAGPGVFKLGYALDSPVPWIAEGCRQAGTVHLGGSSEEIAASERVVARGGHSDSPFVLVAQHSLFDPTRAPAGKHTLWAYCHVPNGSTVDLTTAIERQIERFAPGFRERVLARHAMYPADVEALSANFTGGDINTGRPGLRQLFTRPVPRLNPYATPNPRIYLCSAATPPGGGVHGMSGYHAANAAARGMRMRDEG
ncbi:MAG TPA: NAD(P)/FAD-dependent oxidoreductase [Thermomicrobiales bacterium]|nr:NAD(P)/FAD-dependent oxidoreductase [Thermomicrobiales bacterium]